MRNQIRKAGPSIVFAMALTGAAIAQQQPAPGTPTVLANPPAREPAWAFPVQAGQLPP